HMTLAQVTKRLNDGAALASGRSNVARRGALENNLALAELDPPGWAVCQEDDFHRHLIGKSEDIGGVGPGGLKPDGVTAGQRFGHRVGGCGDATQSRMDNRIVI